VKKFLRSQLIIPITALLVLVVFNMFRDLNFFTIGLVQNAAGNWVFFGNLINIINNASELAILAMGMTLVTAAAKGQDISVGAAAAISGSVFVSIVLSFPPSWGIVLLAFFISMLVALCFGAFNGTLVAVFGIQPMIASLILFTTGRAIAYWINGGATPTIPFGHPAGFLGSFIPGSPLHTPIYLVILCGLILGLVMKFTNLRLYVQSVGVNEKAARLAGISPVRIKLMVFMILGICCTFASVIAVGRLNLINHETILVGSEMDAILAVAIGGNLLGGGRFSIVGSVIGAYVIQALTETLFAMKVPSTDIQAYKAVVIIIIVVAGSSAIKKYAGQLIGKLKQDRGTVLNGRANEAVSHDIRKGEES